MAATTTTAPARRADPSTQALADHIYRDHRHHLLSIAIRNSAGLPDAEEALQDTFVFFMAHFRPDRGTPALPWLTLTLKRHCWAIYRRRRNAPDIPQTEALEEHPDLLHSPEVAAEKAERLAGQKQLLRRLKHDERRALGLLGLGFSYQEIMELTGWTYTKVNRSIRNGRAQLRPRP